MAAAEHGRRARFIADVGSPAGTSAAIVPMLVDWTKDKSADVVDTTNCDDENKTNVLGLGNFTMTLNFNMDVDSDAVHTMCDGEARLFYHYTNRNAPVGKRRYDYGFGRFSLNESGGATAKNAQSVSLVAAGTITRAFV